MNIFTDTFQNSTLVLSKKLDSIYISEMYLCNYALDKMFC